MQHCYLSLMEAENEEGLTENTFELHTELSGDEPMSAMSHNLNFRIFAKKFHLKKISFLSFFLSFFLAHQTMQKFWDYSLCHDEFYSRLSYPLASVSTPLPSRTPRLRHLDKFLPNPHSTFLYFISFVCLHHYPFFDIQAHVYPVRIQTFLKLQIKFCICGPVF